MAQPGKLKTQTLGIEWPVELRFRQGSPTRLASVHVFYDFHWFNEFGHAHTAFKNGQKLAERVRNECPTGKKPTLLLTIGDHPDLASHETDERLIYIVHIRRYMAAKSDAALSFCANAANAKLSDLLSIDPASVTLRDRTAVLKRFITAESLQQLASEDAQYREIVNATYREPALSKEDLESRSSLEDALAKADALGAETLSATMCLIGRILSGDMMSENHPSSFAAELIETCVSHLGISETLGYICNNQLNEVDLELAVESRTRAKALEEYVSALESNQPESYWQKWFERNSWVLGSDFVQVLETRAIDTANIADFLVKAYDGHVDIVEIKRPAAVFWSATKDHENWVPHQDLAKGLTQAQNYQFQLEREMNSIKFQERTSRVPIAKPNALLIYGRSIDWDAEKYRAQRLLNSGLPSITVLTYDEVLTRAKRIMERTPQPSDRQVEAEREFKDEEVPPEIDEGDDWSTTDNS